MKKIMILAAGRGERLKPLTDKIPKALVEVRGKPLIRHHIEKCAACGYTDIVVNLAYRGDQIRQYLGNGEQFGLNIRYSFEYEGSLETGGGIVKALPLLGDENFIVINADVYTDYDFRNLPELDKQLAHLVLVENPQHNQDGDFSLNDNNLIRNKPASHTFAGVAVYHPDFFSEEKARRHSIVPMLRQQAQKNLVSGEVYSGMWYDIGTPERLSKINNHAA